jgi:hypothetical protein
MRACMISGWSVKPQKLIAQGSDCASDELKRGSRRRLAESPNAMPTTPA